MMGVHAAIAEAYMSEPTRIADRYQVHELLGRGGMACVYRVTDTSSGRQLALKQLLPASRKQHSASVVALFEHEFHTLKQLSHPRVIAVYDYGVDTGGPFYTMELLDGGDLLTRAPAPWRELCALLFDVCSSLALLHSRRVLHRDINPRNIRCTQDGKAKLIDFGAMAPMSSGGAQVVGTPAFTPPETLHRLATDARADLFSLGTTFYAALTGELAYPARSFAEAMAAWEVRPPPPSARVPGIPSALDDLILSLISLDPALRPRSAFDVMQRLAALAGLDAQESVAVSRAYLATPALVGRGEILEQLRVAIEAAQTGRGGGVLVRGAPGAGRSRVLDACAVAAMTQGATVLRATASGNPTRFAVVQALLEDVLDALPVDAIPPGFPELLAPAGEPAPGAAPRMQLLDLEESTLELDTLRQAVCRFLLAVSRVQGLVIAIDDVERVDPASASVLAALLDLAGRGRVLIAMTAETEAGGFALEALARRCEQRELRPLDRDETQQLLGSLFGEAAHLDLLAKEIHDIAAGNPRASMDLAQHLVDTGRIQYAAGSWTLPNRLAADDLPRSAEAALHARIDRWSAEARVLAEAQALAFYERFSLGDYHVLLPSAASSSVDRAVSELTAEGALICHGGTYALANRLWTSALKSRLDEASQRERHRALVGLYRAQSALNGIIHHAFAAGMDELGLDTMQVRFAQYTGGVDHKRALEENVTKLVPTHMIGVHAARRLGRSPREVNEILRWAVAASVAAEGDFYAEPAGPLFKQLERDTGLDLWRADSANTNAGDRLMKALTAAQARYQATPEAERVYNVEEAIRRLVEFVVCSIGIGARTLDHALLWSLPPILEPFAPLSPIIRAMWANGYSSAESHSRCRVESARSRWLEVLDTLANVTPAQMGHVDAVRGAIIYAVGMNEAQMGMASAIERADRLDDDPYQKLSALSLRKVIKLQQGDWKSAERLRREAEIVALQMHSPPMFHSLLLVEQQAYYYARDLTGLQGVIDSMKPLAERYPGWDPHLRDAQARFELVRGDARAAKRGFEDCLQRVALDSDNCSRCFMVWVSAQAGLAETLIELDDFAAARRSAEAALVVCDAHGMQSSTYDLVRALALCEAKQGEVARARQRLEALISKQTELGVTGVCMGLSHEARARIAIWAGESQAFEQYASATAREYRHGAQSPLAARYERLIHEATRQGLHTTINLADFVTSTIFDDGTTSLYDVHGAVLRAMAGAQHIKDRASRALRLLCDARGASGGHLFLKGPDGFALFATHVLPAAPEALHMLAREYLLQQKTRTDLISDIATGDLESEEQDLGTRVRVDDIQYDLMLLSCAVGGVGRVAGVAAIAPGAQPALPLPHGLLLNTLATHLLHGDEPA